MNENLFTTLSSHINELSKGHRKIAEFILSHYDKAAFMTASRLGNCVGVSESTVVRFASELGYDGYPEFQRVLQEEMRTRLTAVQRIEVSADRFGHDEVFRSVLLHDIDRIRCTLEETSPVTFGSAVSYIINASRIYIMGIRSSASLASFLGYYFKLMLPNVTVIETGSRSELYEQLMHMSKDDVIIGISFPRYSKQTVHALTYAQNVGAKSIAITDQIDSPISQKATIALLAKSDMVSFVDSLVAPLSLINALIVAVSIKNKEIVSRNFEMLDRIWEEYEVYEKNESGNESAKV